MTLARSPLAQRQRSIDDFASELRKLHAESFNRVDVVQDFLRRTSVSPESLSPYLRWIHNHRDQNCWMTAPIGTLMVQNYRVLAQDIDAGTCSIEPTDTVEMNQSNPVAVDPLEPVHRVYNPAELKQRAVSLHVYSRPFDTCVVYSDQQGTCGTIKLHYTTQYGR
jgi:hypothetical protein